MRKTRYIINAQCTYLLQKPDPFAFATSELCRMLAKYLPYLAIRGFCCDAQYFPFSVDGKRYVETTIFSC